jgi:hypothetical protein
MKGIGQLKLSEALPQLKVIAFQYDLKLNRVKDFKIARMLLAILYRN